MMNRDRSKTICDILGRGSVHPFPARMAPDLALGVMAGRREALRILDPMAGSGTVLAVARANGHLAIGVDMDPLAVLISRVWTTAIDPSVLRQNAAEVLAVARKTFKSLRVREAYPSNANDETRQFVRFWFDTKARRQLASLAAAIESVNNKEIRDALWCAFSRLIISKRSGASLAADLSHSRPHKVFRRAPVEPFSKFLFSVERIVSGCLDSSRSNTGSAVRVHEGDARNLPLDDNSIDLVLTSPPYLNAIDYLRCSKFSLVWMGYTIGEIRSIRSAVVGTTVGKYGDDNHVRSIISKLNLMPSLQAKQEAMLARYIHDMRQIMCETARVLKDGGQAVYVVGENTIGGTFIRNSLIVRELADDAGLRCTGSRSRELPANRRYLPPPSARATALDARMRREVILTLKKV